MKKIIWSCWLQGRQNAPLLVRKCLESWEVQNPEWELRCLDAWSINRYVSLHPHLDLEAQSLTAASVSDVLRILLLHEFGGVWVDATLFCNKPMKDWLPELMTTGFFAFADPVPDRPLSSWFLAAEPGNPIIERWCSAVVAYWRGRPRSNDYFWFHGLFGSLLLSDPPFADHWSRVPYRNAGPPHSLQANELMLEPYEAADDRIDWSIPVFKLTHRVSAEAFGPETLLGNLLRRNSTEQLGNFSDLALTGSTLSVSSEAGEPLRRFASLKVSTENLGDHIQIIASTRMLARLGVTPERFIDRDNEIMSAPCIAEADGAIGILLNGWFKTNRAEWPPHSQLVPIIHGFHIRLFQCPELTAPTSIAYFRRHQPIGCRDVYTQQLLQSEGIDAFVSNCLSLTLPRRISNPIEQTETFVVSRDSRITAFLPQSLGPYAFISHYTGSFDFDANMTQANELLAIYASRAKLIVTTLLHCALPAIAMGIPVIMFYPVNDEAAHDSDKQRFSSLKDMIDIHRLGDATTINWSPTPVDATAVKLGILDAFFEMAQRWHLPKPLPVGPIAPASSLQPPNS